MNSCLNPSERVSVTCMASNLLLVRSRHACVGTLSSIDPAREANAPAPAGSSARLQTEKHPRGAGPSVIRANAESAWCGRRDSSPHNFRHWNLNPARLPVPPRPREMHQVRPRCRGRRLIAWAPPAAAKKWPLPSSSRLPTPAGHHSPKMVRIGLMAKRIFLADRRSFLAGLGAAATVSVLPRVACAEAPQRLMLQAKDATISLRLGQPDTPVWSLRPSAPMLRFKPGQLDVTFQNDLPVPAVLNWHGIDGVAATEPLIAQAPLAPGNKADLAVALRHPGTFVADLRLIGDPQGRPSRPLALVVEE